MLVAERIYCATCHTFFDAGSKCNCEGPWTPLEITEPKLTTTVNEKQVGGRHYKSQYQHWDLVLTHEIHYLLGCASKYVTRSKTDRHQDLEKAIHYVEKMIEASKSGMVEIGCKFFAEREEDIARYARENRLSFREYEAIKFMIFATEVEDLETVTEIIKEIISELPAKF